MDSTLVEHLLSTPEEQGSIPSESPCWGFLTGLGKGSVKDVSNQSSARLHP